MPPSEMGELTPVFTYGVGGDGPGPGGWAWVVPDGPSASGGGVLTTKNRMELTAINEAVLSLSGPLEVYCASNYVIRCFNERWWEGWIRRGWRNSDKKAIPNRDRWSQIIEQVQSRSIAFQWVKPDSGIRWHDEATRLATQAASGQDEIEEQSLF